MEHTPDQLEGYSDREKKAEEKEPYTPRPRYQLVIAWVLIAIVLFAFLGTCYWMVAYGRI